MAETQLRLEEEEHAFLAGLLERELRETLVEEHRTRNPSYRENVLEQERIITGLLAKIKAAAH